MNLKRIIREEMDDFDWVRDIKPIDLTRGRWILHFDTKGLLENEKCQKFIYSQGFEWGDGIELEDMLDNREKYYFNELGTNLFDAYNSLNNNLKSLIENEGYYIYKWSDIKNILNII
jgi:hypothetical protein